MIRYCLPQQIPPVPHSPRSVALGIFDGLHSGHQAVIAAAMVAGFGRCGVYTFAPRTVTTKGECNRLCTAEEQAAILNRLGVMELFEADFATVQHMSPREFVDEVLVKMLHAGAVSCGFNYRFGYGGSGDAALLTQLCAARGISVTVLPPVEVDGQSVNSTAIRRALAVGNMPLVRQLLSRGYCLRLPVMHGQQLGRRLGMPTINQVLPADMALPRFGVYASSVEIDDAVYYGVTNIGIRPTVGASAPLAETWIQGFSGDLYGRTVAVYPIAFLREEKKFTTVEALRAQVKHDGEAVKALFAPTGKIRAVLFDFDDTLALRHPAFAKALQEILKWLYPTADAATLAARHQEMSLFNDYGYGMPCSYSEFFARYMKKWVPGAAVDTDSVVDRFFTTFAACCQICGDVLPVLQELRTQGVPVGVITNGESCLQNAKLTLSGVRPYLDIAVVGGDENRQKPHASVFHRTAARLGIAPTDCLYVGDNPTNDIEGALDAGMHAVWIDRGLEPDNPCYSRPIPANVPTVHSLTDILPWLTSR